VFQVDAGANVTISGLDILGGDAVASYYTGNSGFPTPAAYDGSGGGILNIGTLTLSGCTVEDNDTNPYSGYGVGTHGLIGGGICNFGTMTLSSSTVTSNSSSSLGGGIYNDGTMTLNGSSVTGNAATSGGGIFNDTQGELTILSSVVRHNTAQDGADICSLGSMTISKDSKVGKISYK
jgi:predicted outer membrane repeat protein